MDPTIIQLKRMVYAALMAALTAAGAYIAIPIGPVPIVLQNLFNADGQRWRGVCKA